MCFQTQYLEVINAKEKLEFQVKGYEGNDDERENSINILTKENHDLKREVEELKVSYIRNFLQYCLRCYIT